MASGSTVSYLARFVVSLHVTDTKLSSEHAEYKERAFVLETEKRTFDRALDEDLAFLKASNVMDYSLLIGVVEGNIEQQAFPPAAIAQDTAAGATSTPTFRVRIVDYIGAFTLAKQLESSGKKALKMQDGKGNVTILPPAEYAQRFRTAMRSYFIGCPGEPDSREVHGGGPRC